MLAAPARHPAPPRPGRNLLRPWTRDTRRERRVGYRLAAGLTPAQTARAENLPEAEVASLLADPNFAALVEECRAAEARPEAEARASLTSMARFLLTEALVEGDLRAAMFVLRQEERGRCPTRALVDGVLASRRRAARVPLPPPPSPDPAEPAPATVEPAPAPAPPRAPRDPVDRSLERIGAHFRDQLVGEQLIVHRALTAKAVEASAPLASPPATSVPAASQRFTPTTRPSDGAATAHAAAMPSGPGQEAAPEATLRRPPRNRRERRRSAALARTRRAGAHDPPPPTRDPPPRARSP